MTSRAELKAGSPVNPIGSFTDPEYAHVGLTENKARESHNVVIVGPISGGGGFGGSYYQPFILGWQTDRTLSESFLKHHQFLN